MIMYQEEVEDDIQEGIDLNCCIICNVNDKCAIIYPSSLLSFMYSSFVNVVDQ